MNEVLDKYHRPDYGHLRRFSLTMGLVLLGFSLTGISLEPGSMINLFGISFLLARPQLFTYVLLIATIFGLLRFYYYGLLVTKSPYSARRGLMNRLVCHLKMIDGTKYLQLHSFGMYHGPVNFELGPQQPWMYKRDRKEGEAEPAQELPCAWSVSTDSNGNPIMPEEGVRFMRELETLFPAIWGKRVAYRWNYESREPPMKVRLAVQIPNRCRIAALLEDIDYTTPIWFNFLVIVVFVWSRIVV